MTSTPEERAVAHIARRAAAWLAQRGPSAYDAHALVATLEEHARVTLNFHPDRVRRDGLTVAEGLLRDGLYRSQFDTGVTNGSPTAFPGGRRDRWEEELFGGAYHDGGPPRERPKYGAFNVMAHADGGSPRFGSCYFELSRPVLSRCTFSWGDSHEGPEHVGTIERFEPILAAWLRAIATSGAALGVTGLDVSTLLPRIVEAPRARRPGRALDDYIEAQVHGPIDLARDVEALVIDPSFDDTEAGQHLVAIAERHAITLRRHAGFTLSPAEVPSDFRGPRMPALAHRIAGGAELDAAMLGRAALSLIREPAKWQDWDAEAETWQHIKQLWHVLVRFGRERALRAADE